MYLAGPLSKYPWTTKSRNTSVTEENTCWSLAVLDLLSSMLKAQFICHGRKMGLGPLVIHLMGIHTWWLYKSLLLLYIYILICIYIYILDWQPSHPIGIQSNFRASPAQWTVCLKMATAFCGPLFRAVYPWIFPITIAMSKCIHAKDNGHIVRPFIMVPTMWGPPVMWTLV